jgi:heptosyltransferase II
VSAGAERVLVVGPAWVGDMVMAQSLFMTLKSRFPGCEIDVVAPAWSQPLLARMSEVRAAIVLPLGHGEFGWGVRRALGRELRAKAYGRAIVLPRSFKAALVPFHARVPVRTGYRGEQRYVLLNDMRRLDETRLPQTVQAFVALGLPRDAAHPPPIPEPRLRVDVANRARLAGEFGLDGTAPIAALAPGAEFGPAKQWPPQYFAAVARELLSSGWRVLMLGSAKDAAAAEEITAAAPGVVDLCGHTRLEDTVDLLSLARVLVTNDSGLMHIGAAVGCHVVVMYGPTPPDKTPPLTRRKDVLFRGLACSPCRQRTCPLGHHDCLRGISPATVLDAVRRASGEAGR